MLTEEKLARINELARKSRLSGLTCDEKAEQKNLREEYLANFRRGFANLLESVSIEQADGTVVPLRPAR